MAEGWSGTVHGFIDFIMALGSAGPERKSGALRDGRPRTASLPALEDGPELHVPICFGQG